MNQNAHKGGSLGKNVINPLGSLGAQPWSLVARIDRVLLSNFHDEITHRLDGRLHELRKMWQRDQ